MNDLKIMMVDPAMAECWLTTSKYRGQRPLQKTVVRRYVTEMKRGDWALSESAIVIGCRQDGAKHLLNGQHRLSAIVESGTPQQFLVNMRTFDSDHEMDMAYAIMDRGSKRSFASAIHCLELGDTTGIREALLRKSVAALKLAADGFNENATRAASGMLSSPQVTERLILAWQKPIYAMQNALMGGNTSVQYWFTRASVLGVALITFRYSPERAVEFWPKVIQNDGLIAGSPMHKLYTFLATNNADAKDRGAYARIVANAWNAYFEDRTIQKLGTFKTASAITILGTPWGSRNNRVKVDSMNLILGGIVSETKE